MARRGFSEAQRREAALQGGRRLIARGERPLYRMGAQEGRWTVDALTWVTVTASARREALEEARGAISAWLDVPPDSFDIDA